MESFKDLLGLAGSLLMVYFLIVAYRIFGNAYAAGRGSFDWVGLPTQKP